MEQDPISLSSPKVPHWPSRVGKREPKQPSQVSAIIKIKCRRLYNLKSQIKSNHDGITFDHFVIVAIVRDGAGSLFFIGLVIFLVSCNKKKKKKKKQKKKARKYMKIVSLLRGRREIGAAIIAYSLEN